MEEPVLRLGGPEDLRHADRIHDAFYVQSGTYAPVFNDYVTASTRECAGQWDPERDRIWLAELDGKLVGFVAVRHRAEDELAQLRYLYVDEATRGHGLGTRLVQQVMDFAKDRGYAGIMLWTMDNQTAAGRMYRRFGWTLTETKPAPWHDAFLQQRFDLLLR